VKKEFERPLKSLAEGFYFLTIFGIAIKNY